MSGMPSAEIPVSIVEILNRYRDQETLNGATDWDGLRGALVAREDGIADLLRLGGAQFGLFPQIVAEVLAEIGLGSPLPTEQREMVRAQYVALMEEIRRAQEGGQ